MTWLCSGNYVLPLFLSDFVKYFNWKMCELRLSWGKWRFPFVFRTPNWKLNNLSFWLVVDLVLDGGLRLGILQRFKELARKEDFDGCNLEFGEIFWHLSDTRKIQKSKFSSFTLKERRKRDFVAEFRTSVVKTCLVLGLKRSKEAGKIKFQ